MVLPEPRYVRVYGPVGTAGLARVRTALHGTDLRFYLGNESQLPAAGRTQTSGETQRWLMVDARDVETAKDYLWLRLGVEPADLPMLASTHGRPRASQGKVTVLLRLLALIFVFGLTALMGIACPGLIGPPG